MVLAEKIGEERLEILISVVLLVSALAGNMLAVYLNHKHRIVVTIVTTIILISLMIIGGLTIEGQFESALLRIGGVICGWLISCMLCLKTKEGRKRIKPVYR